MGCAQPIKRFVVVVSADPEPEEIGIALDGYRSMIQADTRRPETAYTLEVK